MNPLVIIGLGFAGAGAILYDAFTKKKNAENSSEEAEESKGGLGITEAVEKAVNEVIGGLTVEVDKEASTEKKSVVKVKRGRKPKSATPIVDSNADDSKDDEINDENEEL